MAKSSACIRIAEKGQDEAAGPSRGPSALLYLIAALVVALLPVQEHTALLSLSSLSLVFGLHAFYWHGGRLITAAGIYSLMSAIMVGYGGLWWANSGSIAPEHMLRGVGIGFFSNVLMYAFFWRRYPTNLGPPRADRRVARWVATAGLIAVPVGLLVAKAGIPLGSAVALGALTVFMFGLSWLSQGWALPLRILCLSLPLLIFALYVFGGYGRLQIAVFALLAAATFSSQYGRLIKLLIILLTPFALIQFSAMRERFGEETFGSELDGLGSVVNPVAVFARTLELGQIGVFEFGEGRPILASLFFWVPREMWPEKPLGFGAQLALVLDPELAARGHSESALVYGEWYYNFGLIGLLLLVPAVGGAIRLIDKIWFRVNGGEIGQDVSVPAYMVTAIVVVGIAYFFWSSSHTFVTRIVPQASVCLAVYLLVSPGLGRRQLSSSLKPPTSPDIWGCHDVR